MKVDSKQLVEGLIHLVHTDFGWGFLRNSWSVEKIYTYLALTVLDVFSPGVLYNVLKLFDSPFEIFNIVFDQVFSPSSLS